MPEKKSYKVHISVESIGVAEVEAESEEDALKQVKDIVQAGKFNVMALHPLYYKGAVEKDIMEYVDLSL